MNSAGIFRNGYSNKKETVAKTEPQQPNNAVSTDSSLPMDERSGISTTEPNGKSTVSDDKVSENNSDEQGKEKKNASEPASSESATISPNTMKAEPAKPAEAEEEAGNSVLYQRVGQLEELTEEEIALRDSLVERMRKNGIEIETDDAEGQRVLDDANAGVKEMRGVKYFRTKDGQVYGFVSGGKIYLDPKIATAETPIHEYSHLWAEALRQANPAAWRQLVGELQKEQDVVDYVKALYPELSGTELWDEVFAHYSGRRGAERLRQERDAEMSKAKGVFNKARIASMFNRITKALQRYWIMARELFSGYNRKHDKMSAEDFADMALADMVMGENFYRSRTVPYFDNEEITTHLSSYKTQHNLKSRGIVTVINNEQELESVLKIIDEDKHDIIRRKFYDENVLGVASVDTGMVFIFPSKLFRMDDVESVWWHENTHIAWIDIEMPDKEECGWAAFEWLKENDTDRYEQMINGRYSKQELPSESTCRLVEHIIENYGLDVFLNKDFEDNEKVAKLVTALQNYYKYGKRREKGEEGGDTPERNAATIGQAEGVVEKNGHGRERHNRIGRFKGESRGNTSEISGVGAGSLSTTRGAIGDINDYAISQGFGSAGTSLRQVASGLRKVYWKKGTTNLDLGGGRIDECDKNSA